MKKDGWDEKVKNNNEFGELNCVDSGTIGRLGWCHHEKRDIEINQIGSNVIRKCDGKRDTKKCTRLI